MSDESRDDAYDRILDEILESEGRGESATAGQLARRHPGHEEHIRRALASIENYRQLRAQAARVIVPVLDELAAGARVGDFEIVDRLASGGMGVVYRARQLSLGRRIVALKVLAAGGANLHGAARFQREALQLAGLHHPHLAEVFGFGEDRGRLFLAMRLVEGANLRDILETRATQRATGDDPRELRVLVERIAEVADALALAHSRGLVHRDVKPSNIVLEGVDRSHPLHNGAVLVDFGLARPVDERVLTLSGASPATPSYAPPEQLLGQAVDARADVFSLGVTLHDLLSARRPTERLQASAGLEPIEQLAPRVDKDLAAVVARAVDPEARWRYGDAAALRDDLRAWLAGEPVSARSLPWRERARRSLARDPRRVVRVTLACAALLVVTIGFSLGPGAELQAVRRARERHERGDLLDLARAAAGLSEVTVSLFEQRDELGRALERVRSASPDDALRRTLDALEANDMGGALGEAASALGAKEGPDLELLERFFLAVETDAGLHARMRASDVDTWAILLGRLFYERPVETLSELERCAPYQAALRSAWSNPELSERARNYLATAWGGLGRPEDGVIALLESITSTEAPLEQVRLHLHNATRILRRALLMGIADGTPFDACWSRLESIAARLDHMRDLGASSQPYSLESQLIDTLVALALAQRSTSQAPPSIVGWPALQRWLESRGAAPSWWNGWSLPLAATQAPELVARLAQPDAMPFLHAHTSAQLGWISALLTSHADVARRLEEFVATHRSADDQAAFAAALARARDAARGRVEEEQLDSDTLLGWRPISPELAPLPGRRDPGGAPRRGSLPKVEFDPIQHREALAVAEVTAPDAEWWFEDQEARWRGDALAPRAVATRMHRESEQHSLLLHGFGLSELELSFEIAPPNLARSRWLVLHVHTNNRSGYPNFGDAWLQVAVNDVDLCATSAFRDHPTQIPIALNWSSVRAGVNRIQLRLLATSTSPLRVIDARVTTLP